MAFQVVTSDHTQQKKETGIQGETLRGKGDLPIETTREVI